ncbi:MAG: lytic transglycosylase domain-containing protein, partial [Holosporales bacterium]|nr:lytic transglycosylase domain-containing protein [Holosporales bacterium]
MPLTLICCIFSFFVPTESLSTRLSSSEEQAITACRIAIHKAEGSYRIPPRLLESIALIESGRSTGAATSYPWPWTVTVNGKGHYFPTRSEAIAAVRRFQARGARNIDVGCMQINLFHHPKAFKSLQEAFDITQNVSYAAKFLKELQEQYASWSKAVGCYHSATPHLHGAYRHRVLKKWA